MVLTDGFDRPGEPLSVLRFEPHPHPHTWVGVAGSLRFLTLPAITGPTPGTLTVPLHFHLVKQVLFQPSNTLVQHA
jgi:hypothetical protein